MVLIEIEAEPDFMLVWLIAFLVSLLLICFETICLEASGGKYEE